MNTTRRSMLTLSLRTAVLASIVGLLGCGPQPFRLTPEFILPKTVHSTPWLPDGDAVTYDANNVQDYLKDGVRPALDYGLSKLIHATYSHNANRKRQMSVDVYEMTCPLAAYGLYSCQRPDKAEEIRLGADGYWGEGKLGFVKESIYVLVKPPGDAVGDMAAAMLIAGYVDGRLPLPTLPPEMLGVFPPEDLIAHSQKYLVKDLLGHPFLGGGWQASYRYRGVTHGLFFITCQDSSDALQRYEKIAAHVSADGQILRQVPGLGRAAFSGMTKAIGRLFVACGETCIVGAIECYDDERSVRLARTMMENLAKLKL